MQLQQEYRSQASQYKYTYNKPFFHGTRSMDHQRYQLH